MLKDHLPKDWISPGDAIKKFGAESPDTIRDAVLIGCIKAFLDPSLEMLSNFGTNGLEQFNSILDDVRPRDRAAECAKLIGVMELVLVHSEGAEAFYQEVAEETGERVMHEMAMRAPLRERHYRIAHDKFYEMRETVLSAKALWIWQGLLEETDPIWPQAEGPLDDHDPS